MNKPLAPSAINDALSTLPGWTLENNALKKTFTLENFKDAFAFMTRIAFEAEALGHHPAWHNVYNTVALELSTHDAGNQVTQRDIDLATAIERIAEQ